MDFLLTIRFRFPALDDIEARQKAVILLDDIGIPAEGKEGVEVKFQRLEQNKPPIPVLLEKRAANVQNA